MISNITNINVIKPKDVNVVNKVKKVPLKPTASMGDGDD